MALFRRQGIKLLWTLVIAAVLIWVWQLSTLFWLNILDGQTTIHDPGPVTELVADWSEPKATDSTVPETGDEEAGSGTEGTGNEGAGSGAEGSGAEGSGSTPGGTGTGGTEDEGAGSEPDEGTDEGGTQPTSGGGGGGGGGGSSIKPAVIVVENDADLLYINTDIDYGTVFPGESGIEGEFSVHINNAAWEGNWGDDYAQVTYRIFLRTVAGYLDLGPYLSLERDPAEGDANPDTMAAASVDNQGDESDRWIVTLNNVPDGLGEYQVEIVVELVSHTLSTKELIE